jgi:galactoside O-acetyltransferase
MSRYITAEMFAPQDTTARDSQMYQMGRRPLVGIGPKTDTAFRGMVWAYVGADVHVYDPVVILKPEMIRLEDGVRIDSFVKVEGGRGVYLGPYVHLSSFCHINGGGGTVVIGEHVGMASGVKVIGGSNKMDAPSMSAAAPRHLQHIEYSRTVIEAYAFLSTNAVILPGVTVGEGAVVGAGAVVTKDVPAWEVWAGVPARKIGERPRPAAGSVFDMLRLIEWGDA